MAFWKKSEDPWDMDPEKRKKQKTDPYEREWSTDRDAPEPEGNSLLDAAREQWTRWRKEKREALHLPPEPCPWCGKDMEQGFLSGGRGICWQRGVPNAKALWIGTGSADTMRVDVEGVLATYKTAWYCPACEKMVFDASDLQTQMEETRMLNQEGLCSPREDSPEMSGSEDV